MPALSSRTFFHFNTWEWLLAPTFPSFVFAIRTSFAAAISLLIAMWMELDSPAWAPLTVWVVALTSRGESLAKARWRVVGTVIGCMAAMALIAAFPQQSGLFFPVLALWVGTCCATATLLDGYPTYGLLVASFTSTIVATGAASNPDTVFDVAVSRGTYIILGVLCETLLAILSMPNLQAKAHLRLLNRLYALRSSVSEIILHARERKDDPTVRFQLLGELAQANNRLTYDAMEMGPHLRVADHARAALACLVALLARSRVEVLAGEPAENHWLAHDWNRLEEHIHACEVPRHGDRFRFRVFSRRSFNDARDNGLRACGGILGAWLIWETTAWPAGLSFVSFVSLVYGLLATRENPLLASSSFLAGGIFSVAAATLCAFLLVPAVTSPELLVVVLMPFMVVGGLAATRAETSGYAFSFNMFLPVLIGPSNQGRYDEIGFLNGAMAFLCAILFARWTYRSIMPFQLDHHMRSTERWIGSQLRALARNSNRLDPHEWLVQNANSLVRLTRVASRIPAPALLPYMERSLTILERGLILITLRDVQRAQETSPALKNALTLFLHHWQKHGFREADVRALLNASSPTSRARDIVTSHCNALLASSHASQNDLSSRSR
ncbi:FUSC family protein [Acetobacter estunensis]|uniref:FUSC family protein n=1 Tax=Acetobacter estunensis TaxID=104097 RepID=UPI001C2CDEE3|nr:FUSC family protein [Acetobacter estunensis]MBV1836314.1 FUSC family protein [Acetobacter estunensis]